jgi:hypothetical protein
MGSSILIYFPCISKSITFPLQGLVQKLLDKGHEVTFVTSYTLNKNPGVINIEVGEGIRRWADTTSSAHLFSGKDLNETNLFELSMTAQEESLKALAALDKVWDTVIVYPAFGNEVGLYLAEKMKANLVLYITDMPTTAAWIDHAFGYYEEGGEAFRDSAVQTAVMEVVRRQWPQEKMLLNLSIEDIERKASLILGQGNPLIMKGLRPVPPTMVYCGMMQCRQPQPLPTDLQKFMDDATEGVLYVSFGSVLQGSQLPEDKLKAMIEAFGKLKEKVLFKWESDTMTGKPDNVMVKSFLPQQDILGHPNLKAFITHAGYLSFEEALCHQTPMIATPICYDQFANADEIVKMGIGLSVKFTDITEPILSDLIDKVMHCPEYKTKATMVGSALSPWKELVGPVDRAVWWIEHITANPGVYSISDFYPKSEYRK